MAIEVRLPQLGETMEEGTIVSFMVRVGDKVKKGDCIFEVETDKAAMEVESPADGFVKHLLAELGQTLPVGQPVLILGDKDEQITTDFIDELMAEAAPASAKPKAALTSTPIEKVPADQSVEHAIVSAAEIKPAFSEVSPRGGLGATIPLGRIQKITAQKMLQSKREIPCFYLNVRADVTDLVDLRTRLNKTSDVEISYNDFIMRAVAMGMQKFPLMTGRLVGETIQLPDEINIGLAVSVPDGVVVPVVKDIQKKNLLTIARDSKSLIEKAIAYKLAPADLEGACITISNLGPFGVESFIPIVVPGQCSILGIGKITDACIPDNGGYAVRKLMSLTLSVDHRVTNGVYASEFLDFVRKLLEDTACFI